MKALVLSVVLIAAATVFVVPTGSADTCVPSTGPAQVCEYDGPFGPCFYVRHGASRALCLGP
jgi:hypothetical protein